MLCIGGVRWYSQSLCRGVCVCVCVCVCCRLTNSYLTASLSVPPMSHPMAQRHPPHDAPPIGRG